MPLAHVGADYIQHFRNEKTPYFVANTICCVHKAFSAIFQESCKWSKMICQLPFYCDQMITIVAIFWKILYKIAVLHNIKRLLPKNPKKSIISSISMEKDSVILDTLYLVNLLFGVLPHANWTFPGQKIMPDFYFGIQLS